MIVGSGAGSVTVGSGTGRLGSPLGGGVVGAAVVDTGVGVLLLAAEVGESLADGEPPVPVALLVRGPAAVTARLSAEIERVVEPAAERTAVGD
ncbi:MAG TPA: hypothetical protein VH857_07775 [Actinomycetes bacterium]|nr:hypothetical protein [Actinomycetes bacterium]